MLSPEETKKVYPLMNVDDLYGTLYSPGDGTIDPASWAASLTKGAVLKGAKVSVFERRFLEYFGNYVYSNLADKVYALSIVILFHIKYLNATY